MYNDYPLPPDKLEIKREMLSDYHLKIADDYNISIDTVKKLSLASLTNKIMPFITKICSSI